MHGFADQADAQVVDALMHADVDQPGHPLLDRAEAVFTILEHEAMHQETLLYMWHRLPFAQKRKPSGYEPRTGGSSPRSDWVEIPGGCATLGVDRGSIVFGWDNEFPALSVDVPAFSIERHDVTNERFLEFVDAGGYRDARGGGPKTGSGFRANASPIRCSGSGPAGVPHGNGAACSTWCRCRRPGRCM